MKIFNFKFKLTVFVFLIIFLAQDGTIYAVVTSSSVTTKTEEEKTQTKTDMCNQLKENRLFQAKVISALEEYCKS